LPPAREGYTLDLTALSRQATRTGKEGMMAAEKKQTDRALIESLGAEKVTYHKGGARLLMGGRTVAYAAETKKGIRLRVMAASLPASLAKGLEVSPIASKGQLSVLVPVGKEAKVRPILEHVAAKQAAAARAEESE
jgi:hypothetical protein